MLFDEPTSALDPEMIKEVLDTMTDLPREGMTMICVTHDLRRIIEERPPEAFFTAPDHERTQLILSQVLGH